MLASSLHRRPPVGAWLRTPGSGYFVKVAEPRLRWRGRSRFSYPRCGSLAGLAVRGCSGGMTVFSDSGRRVPAAHGELLGDWCLMGRGDRRPAAERLTLAATDGQGSGAELARRTTAAYAGVTVWSYWGSSGPPVSVMPPPRSIRPPWRTPRGFRGAPG